jgi:hypothetical protein
MSANGTTGSWSPWINRTGGFTRASAANSSGRKSRPEIATIPATCLSETHKDKPVRRQPLVVQSRIQEGVKIDRRRFQSGLRRRLGRAVEPGDRKPLMAKAAAHAAFGRIGGDKGHARQVRRHRVGQTQKVAPVRAIAMQKHDQPRGLTLVRPCPPITQFPHH